MMSVGLLVSYRGKCSQSAFNPKKMLEEKDQELHSDAGGNVTSETTEEVESSEKTSGKPAKAKTSKTAKAKGKTAKTADKEPAVESKEETGAENEDEEKTTSKTVEKEQKDDVLDEIDESNAEDAEDEDNHRRHHIPMHDYQSMSMENLVGELQRLIRTEKVQAIKNHVDAIKSEFDLKFQDFLEEKKEEFVSNGGNEIDFRYNSVAKRQFNEVYAEYREKRNQC